MAEQLPHNENYHNPRHVLAQIIGTLGTKLTEIFPQTPSHFADEYTKSRFTRQGVIVVEKVLPKAGVNLRIKATPLDEGTS